eukprot:TRINITY_DN5306_c0_g1_i1.p1 TRINITY_DN5306_c0_g1~~TRINITY_DN5306_c0_g1_i1.p1  ORF type:complete len:314 (+),score=67.11 TRINITY_DN5306_c0_g1_i1:53-943(+)
MRCCSTLTGRWLRHTSLNSLSHIRILHAQRNLETQSVLQRPENEIIKEEAWVCIYDDPEIQKLKKRTGRIGLQFLAGLPICGLLCYFATPFLPLLMGAYFLYPSLQLLLTKVAADNIPQQVFVHPLAQLRSTPTTSPKQRKRIKSSKKKQQNNRNVEEEEEAEGGGVVGEDRDRAIKEDEGEKQVESALLRFRYLNPLSASLLFGFEPSGSQNTPSCDHQYHTSQILQRKPTWVSPGVLNDVRILLSEVSHNGDATDQSTTKTTILSADGFLSKSAQNALINSKFSSLMASSSDVL